MKTVILPGYSLKNRDWAEDIAKDLLSSGIETFVHYWRHWQGGAFMIAEEIELIKEDVGNDNINIIAKSIGTIVLMNLLDSSSGIEKKINKVILCGIPMDAVHDDEQEKFKNNLYKIASPNIVLFQNINDPHSKITDVKQMVSKINPDLAIIEKLRSDHEYPFSEEFTKFLSP